MILNPEDDFDLGKTAVSGQCFRWERMGDAAYRIVALDDCIYAEQTGKGTIVFDCDEETFRKKWHDYFDLNENYRKIRRRIRAKEDPFLHAAAKKEKGIRILKQDPWETLVSFIISQNRNIPAIRNSIALLSAACGQKKTDSAGREYHCFPTPDAIMRLSEEELSACKLGYRAKYVRSAADVVLRGELDREALSAMSCSEVIPELTKLYGVGEKVASCVALFGLHQLDAFPVDVWVKRILDNEYKGGYPYEKYSPYNGVYQQYMFAYYREQHLIAREDTHGSIA